MATIALSGTSLNYTMGMGAFQGLGKAFSDAKRTSGGLRDALNTLKSKIDIASVAAKVDTLQEQAQKAQARESEKTSSLTLAYEKLDTLICDTGTIDCRVSGKISSREDDFYKRYYYLKPECKKTGKEKASDWWADGWQGFKDFWGGLGNAIASAVKDFVNLCKEHWKEFIKVISVVLLVAASILLLVFVPGGGLLSAVLLGAAKGCLIGLVTSVVINGVVNKCKGKGFWEGAIDAAFSGAVGGFIGGAVAGGFLGNSAAFGKTATKGLLKATHSLLGSTGQGALVGATTSCISNASVTTLSYWLENGTLKGAGKSIIQSAFCGAVSGGIMGGATGALSYGLTRLSDKIAAWKAEKQPTFNEKGGVWNDHAMDRLKTTYPTDDIGSQIMLKSKYINSKYGVKRGNVMDATRGIKIKQPDGSYSYDIKLYEFKSSQTAPTTINQDAYWAKHGNKLLADVFMTKKGQGLYGNITILGGTEVNVIRPSTIMTMIGFRLYSTPFNIFNGGVNNGAFNIIKFLED